jgi:hypothetical protein
MKMWSVPFRPSIGSAGRGRSLVAARAIGFALAVAAVLFSSSASLAATPPTLPSPTRTSPPVLAYYYMWFNSSSWTHAKTDIPALGPYTSTDKAVIHQEVTWAKQTGVDAFIVSWKDTPSLNQALAELVAECQSQGLKLVLLYEGLDVNRNPIATSIVSSDLAWFMSQYGSNPVFDVFGKPAIVWSGTWRFSDADIATIRDQIGAPTDVLLLGSEKGAAAYQARADLFDGDAYYWSSADPDKTPGYATRLNQLSAAVHAAHGLWLAPAAAGFDAVLNGGTTVVSRRNGATLQAAWTDALATNPDGVAVISWNEFTENSYIEPSRKYGYTYLQVLAKLTGALGPTALASSSPTAPPTATAPPAGPSPASGKAGGTTGGTGSGHPTPPYDLTPTLVASAVVFLLLVLIGFNLRSRGRREGDGDEDTSESGANDGRGSLGRPA